jgi:hypothetical protein
VIKSLVYILATACAGIIGAVYVRFTGNSVTTWLSIGYLYIASIWVASWYVRRHSVIARSRGGWLTQIAISLFWWPAALLAGVLAAFVTQSFSFPTLVDTFLVYGFASVVAVGLGIVSLRVEGATLTTRFFSWLVGANVAVFVVTHVIFNRFLFSLSNQYDFWLMLIIFVPLGTVNGCLYGIAFPVVAKPLASTGGGRGL